MLLTRPPPPSRRERENSSDPAVPQLAHASRPPRLTVGLSGSSSGGSLRSSIGSRDGAGFPGRMPDGYVPPPGAGRAEARRSFVPRAAVPPVASEEAVEAVVERTVARLVQEGVLTQHMEKAVKGTARTVSPSSIGALCSVAALAPLLWHQPDLVVKLHLKLPQVMAIMSSSPPRLA